MAYTVGDWVTDFALPSTGGKTVTMGDTLGMRVLLLLPRLDEPAILLLQNFANLFPEFTQLQANIFPIQCDCTSGPGAVPALPFPVLRDVEGKLAAAYDAGVPRTVLIDISGRCVGIYDSPNPASHALQVLADVKAMLSREQPRHITAQVPILLIPNVISQEFCQELMHTWETEGNRDSGLMQQVDGRTVGQLDYKHKIRRDHFIQVGGSLHRKIGEYLGRRITGEVFKAFNYQVTRIEQMKIACYDAAQGGYFRPHRDNTTEATAHRRFACSLLLNDQYEGGYLRFPEYGPHLYRPQSGGAVIFSSSLLHEATDVTAGRRFVLLTFFFGEREAKLREEYNIRTGGAYRASAS